MIWAALILGLAVLILGIIVLAVFSQGFRKIIGGTLVIAIGLIVWQGVREREQERRAEQKAALEAELARHRISPSEIELADVVLLTGDSLAGRVRNKSSRYTVRSVGLKITFQDCALETQVQHKDVPTSGPDPSSFPDQPSVRGTVPKQEQTHRATSPSPGWLPGPAPGRCEIIGEHLETISEDVPPGQARDFKVHISEPQPTPRGELRWYYEIEYIDAREPNQTP
jgi:hypothetical protein